MLAGNCGFSLAPTRRDARAYTKALFAKVEGMAPVALDGVVWDFEAFPEYLALDVYATGERPYAPVG